MSYASYASTRHAVFPPFITRHHRFALRVIFFQTHQNNFQNLTSFNVGMDAPFQPLWRSHSTPPSGRLSQGKEEGRGEMGDRRGEGEMAI